MTELIDFAYKTNKRTYIAVNNQRAFWSANEVRRYKCVTSLDLKSYIGYLVDHIYVTLGDTFHRQVIGIPLGISCAPLPANLFLMIFGYKFMIKDGWMDA